MQPHGPRLWKRSRHPLTDCKAAVDVRQWQETPAVVRRRLGRFDDCRIVGAMSYRGRGDGLVTALTSAAMAHFVSYGHHTSHCREPRVHADGFQSISGAIRVANHANRMMRPLIGQGFPPHWASGA